MRAPSGDVSKLAHDDDGDHRDDDDDGDGEGIPTGQSSTTLHVQLQAIRAFAGMGGIVTPAILIGPFSNEP